MVRFKDENGRTVSLSARCYTHKLEQELMVERWKHPVGTKVDLLMDNGQIRRTTTRSNAQMLGGHSAVIWLEGVSGAYLLDRVRVADANSEQELIAFGETLGLRSKK